MPDTVNIYSPTEFKSGEVYIFNIYHLIEVDDPCELFPVHIKDVGRWTFRGNFKITWFSPANAFKVTIKGVLNFYTIYFYYSLKHGNYLKCYKYYDIICND